VVLGPGFLDEVSGGGDWVGGGGERVGHVGVDFGAVLEFPGPVGVPGGPGTLTIVPREFPGPVGVSGVGVFHDPAGAGL